ncbi:MAG TPA: HlyD family efflux transporter periplasmic adaptor subunit [Candidatus Binataceae bacterium]|nr:HlyD family efflux transporter periplasmic adaptor subunit [Candidatus Binataceae bacterium]
MRRLTIFGLVIVLAVLGATGWWFVHHRVAPNVLTLYGNVDLREVELPFNDSERIAAVLVQEGDRVRQGQVLARLDTSRLVPEVAQVRAQAAAQAAVVERMHHGSRPEEIAEARANLEQAEADAVNARRDFARQKILLEGSATSRQNFDDAKTAAEMADARVELNRKALDLAVKGPRQEDIDQAEAQLRADQAQVALLEQQLADANLVAPRNAIVRSRLMEPGEMASPQKPVFSLAITDPKWVRAYVSEAELGLLHPGMYAWVTIDSFPNRRFAGWIGFISSVAEFTPKSVETAELRTSLVYEVRVFVKDPADDLRLGMPATVFVPLEQSSFPTSGAGIPLQTRQ